MNENDIVEIQKRYLEYYGKGKVFQDIQLRKFKAVAKAIMDKIKEDEKDYSDGGFRLNTPEMIKRRKELEILRSNNVKR